MFAFFDKIPRIAVVFNHSLVTFCGYFIFNISLKKALKSHDNDDDDDDDDDDGGVSDSCPKFT